MADILQYKTIQSQEKKDFEEQISKHLEQGWTLVKGGYSFDDGIYTREMIYKKNKNEVVTFRENKSVELRYKINSKDQKHGQYIYYYSNGEKNSEGLYKNDHKEGVWKSWYENGEKWDEGLYKDDKKEEIWKSWYENGNLKEEVEYKEGCVIGKFHAYYDDGYPMLEGEFEDPRKIIIPDEYWPDNHDILDPSPSPELYNRCGIWKFWDKENNCYEGVPSPSIYFYKLKKGKSLIDYNILEFSTDTWGREPWYIFYGLKVRSNPVPIFYSDNSIYKEFYYDGVIKHFHHRTLHWNENWNKRLELNKSRVPVLLTDYEYLKVGESVDYYHNGKIQENKNYQLNNNYTPEQQKDYAHGEYRLNYIDGEPCITGNYNKQLEFGTWVRYHPNGQRESVFTFEYANNYAEMKIKTDLYNKDGTMLYSGFVTIEYFKDKKHWMPQAKIDFITEYCELDERDWKDYVLIICLVYGFTSSPRERIVLMIDPEHFDGINKIKLEGHDNDYNSDYYKIDILHRIASNDILSYYFYDLDYYSKNAKKVLEVFPYPNKTK